MRIKVTHKMNNKTICVIGLGYIGLPTAAVFASCKVKVIGVDVNSSIVDIVNSGQIHIVEPDLDEAVHVAVQAGYLRATTKPEQADAFLIAVPTPFSADGNEDPEPDLRFIKAATQSIATVLKPGDLVILESTSPVGTTEHMAEWLAGIRPDLTFPHTHGETSDIRIAYCPERVLPGQVLRELLANDRVIGGITPRCSEVALKLYKIFLQGECVVTNARTAEMCKLTENSFRDVNIAFANELSMICDKQGINVWELIKLANRHPRVTILQPGPGVGGHCIAVDPWFIVSKNPIEARLIRTAREVNNIKPKWVLKKLKLAVDQHLKTKTIEGDASVTIGCFGLAFKADIDDLRESPAVEIIKSLAAQWSGELLVVEPNITALPNELQSIPNIRLVATDIAVKEAHVILMLVNHRQFYEISKDRLRGKQVIDTRGVWQ